MTSGKLRVDKWLWHARFFKTRTLAAKIVSGGHVRVNSDKISKPAHSIVVGDVLTFAQGNHIRVIEVLALGERRGPAPEAQTLYLDKSPIQEKDPSQPKSEGKGRPTKKDRRNLDLIRGQSLE
jgi:ribosome-associated heat shock protein Hsp15